MSENSEPLSLEKPQELLDLEKAVMDLNAFNSAVRVGTFPGSHSEIVTNLLNFIKQTYIQLEAQYRNHPFIQEQMAKVQEQEELKAKQKQEDEEAMRELGLVNA